MIEIEHLNKTYPSPGGDIHALRDVNLRIEDGEIFGIIGLSGAGKSTLVRCINLLERPTSGTVRIDGRDMTQLSRRDLLKARQDIGMIFQSFNLLEQRSVLRNVCYPLEIAGTPKEAAKARARELLALCPAFDCLDEYRARCFVPGHWVTVCAETETYAAKALAIDEEGRLVIQRENGRQEALRCGEVTTRPARTE